MRTAYLLVSHGSSDPRHQAGLNRLAQATRPYLTRSLAAEPPSVAAILRGQSSLNSTWPQPSASWPLDALASSSLQFTESSQDAPIIGVATLEAHKVSLAQQIAVFAQNVWSQGMRQVVIVPLFLLAGIHVKEDLPQEIAAAEAQLPARLQLTCAPYLGGAGDFKHYVSQRLARVEADQCILLAHGSRRPAGNRAIQKLGAIFDTDVAFWSVPPDLETQVANSMQRGYRRIAIAPFFLFPGSITDVITRRTEALAEAFPKLSLRLLSPLGISADLGQVVADLALSAALGSPKSRWQPGAAHSVAKNTITA
ncbi:MAG: sirohydrochlorin chelatase [Leptolyngbyaceae cyanobacterium]|mgnify:CR=1 FL=1